MEIKISKNLTISTDGKGYWSTRATEVKITLIKIKNDSELRVYFDTNTWNVNTDGLIYSDRQFLKELREDLETAGYINVSDINYFEQGAQGKNYVSLDVGRLFMKNFAAK